MKIQIRNRAKEYKRTRSEAFEFLFPLLINKPNEVFASSQRQKYVLIVYNNL